MRRITSAAPLQLLNSDELWTTKYYEDFRKISKWTAIRERKGLIPGPEYLRINGRIRYVKSIVLAWLASRAERNTCGFLEQERGAALLKNLKQANKVK